MIKKILEKEQSIIFVLSMAFMIAVVIDVIFMYRWPVFVTAGLLLGVRLFTIIAGYKYMREKE